MFPIGLTNLDNLSMDWRIHLLNEELILRFGFGFAMIVLFATILVGIIYLQWLFFFIDKYITY